MDIDKLKFGSSVEHQANTLFLISLYPLFAS